jgi:hypothetical protein
LLYEIDANTKSYNKNTLLTEKGNRKYSRGVTLTTIAIFISIILLLVNKFIVFEKEPAKVRIVKMSHKSLNTSCTESSYSKSIYFLLNQSAHNRS